MSRWRQGKGAAARTVLFGVNECNSDCTQNPPPGHFECSWKPKRFANEVRKFLHLASPQLARVAFLPR